ncbi:MAG: AMP-binding protein [Acidobacteria bacterium]|nr:AMP-binding protein [Acidobacteriota bacterium]MYJ05796.1 AMP-binding protein [Acidobacteriota bacterium]
MRRATLLDFFDDRIRSGRPFLVYDGGYRAHTWTYDDIRRAAGRFARRLERAGVTPGANILLWGENRAEWVVAFWGCLLSRAVAVPIDVRASPDLLERVARIVSARIVVAGRDLPVPPLDGAERWDLDGLLDADSPGGDGDGGGDDAAVALPRGVSGSDLAEIIFTSGATAEPKGVRITHANVLANIVPVEREILKYRRYGRPFFPLRFLNLLPLSHMFGQAMATFIPPTLEGVTVFMRGYNPADIVRQVRTRRVSVLVSVPKILEVLRDHVIHEMPETAAPLDRPESVGRRWWRYRRVHRMFGFKFWAFVVGAAPLDPEVEAFWSRLGFLVIQGYGLTETAPIVTLNHPFHARRGSVGTPIGGVDVKIAGDGEILVRGANVTAGYYNAPEATAEAFRDGWFHTGDIGAFDDEGRLTVRGRKKEMIVTPDGLNVFPDDVERALRAQANVRDAGVVGGGPPGGEHVHAVLVLEPNAGADAVVREANALLEDHQRIRSFSVWPNAALPRTEGTQKLKRAALKRWVEKDAGRSGGTDAESGPPAAGHTVEEVVAHFAHGRTVTGATTLEELGLSSIERIELMLALERRFATTVDETAFAALSTVDDLRTLVESDPAAGIGGRGAEAASDAGLTGTGPVAPAEEPPSSRSDGALIFPTWSQLAPVRLFRRLAQSFFLLPLGRCFAWTRVEGLDHLGRTEDPVLYAANHQSLMDGPVILAALPAARRRVATAAAREWFAPHFHPERFPPGERFRTSLAYFLGVLCFNIAPLPQRTAGAREAMRHLGTLLGRGSSVLIFPEGRRNVTGHIDPFQPGVGMLASRLQVPVVPVRIDGIDRVLPIGARWARPGRVRIAFGEPLRFDGNDYAAIARRIEQAVRDL